MLFYQLFSFSFFLLVLNNGLSAQQWQPLGQIYQDTSCNYEEELQIQLIQEGKMLVKSQTSFNNTSLGKHQVYWLVQEAGQWQEQKTVVINNIAPKEQAQSLFSEDGQYWVLLRTVLLHNKARDEHKLCIQLQRFKWKGTAWDLQASQKDTLVILGWALDRPSHHSTLQLSKEGKVALLYHTINIHDGQQTLLQTYHWQNNHWNKKLELKEVHEPQLSSNGKTIALLKIEDIETLRNSWVVTYYQQNNNWQLLEQNLAEVQGAGYSHDQLFYTGYWRRIELSGDGKTLGITYFPGKGEVWQPKLSLYQLKKVGEKTQWLPKGQLSAPTLQYHPQYWQPYMDTVQAKWGGEFGFSYDGNQLAFMQVIDSLKKQTTTQQLLYYHWQDNAWRAFRKPLEWWSAVYKRGRVDKDYHQFYFWENKKQLSIQSYHPLLVLDTLNNSHRTVTCQGNTLRNYAWMPPAPSYGNSTLTACQEYPTAKGQIIRESGIYQDTLVNYQGGDSLVTLQLTLIKIDAELYSVGEVLLNADTSAQVQWIYCPNNGPELKLEGARQHYFIPPQTGHYRAEISKQGCVVSSKTVFYKEED